MSFIDNFNISLQNLEAIKGKIKTYVNRNKEFSNITMGKLKTINQKVKEIGGLIQQLLSELNSLRKKSGDIDSIIKQKDLQIIDLTKQIQKLNEEKNLLENEGKQIKEQMVKQQQAIDAKEAQIRKLTEDFENKQRDMERINKELQDNQSRDLVAAQQKCADEMAKIQIQINNLTEVIKQKDNQINELTNELNTVKAELAKINTDGQGMRSQLENMQKENDDLKKTNTDLIERIVNATGIMVSTVDAFNELSEGSLNDVEMNKLLLEIENNLTQISNSLQGRSPLTQSNSNETEVTIGNSAPPEFPTGRGGRRGTRRYKKKGGFIYNKKSRKTRSSTK